MQASVTIFSGKDFGEPLSSSMLCVMNCSQVSFRFYSRGGGGIWGSGDRKLALLHFEERLNPYNHSPLFPYLTTLLGDTFPVGSVGGQLGDVLFQPKYAGQVYKLLLLTDQLGNYRWMGGLELGARSDTRIFQSCGPPTSMFRPGEAVLLDGGFPGRRHGVIPFAKPPKRPLPEWCAKYNDGHGFIRGRVEHVFMQLWSWGVCRETFRKHGNSVEDRMQRVQWLVRSVVHIQQFINRRNVRYEPFGPWDHFPASIFGQDACKRNEEEDISDDTSSSSSSSDSDASNVSSLTSAE